MDATPVTRAVCAMVRAQIVVFLCNPVAHSATGSKDVVLVFSASQ